MDLFLFKDISLILNSIGIGNCLLLSVLYCNKTNPKSKAGRLLALLFFLLSFIIFNTIISFSGYGEILKNFEYVSNALSFSIAPTLYLFLRCSQNDKYQINLYHFSGTFLYLFFLSVQYLYVNGQIFELAIYLLKSELIKFIWNLHFFIYLLTLVIYCRKDFVTVKKLHLVIIGSVSLIWMINLFLYIFSVFHARLNDLYLQNITLFFTVVALWMTYKNLSARNSLQTVRLNSNNKGDDNCELDKIILDQVEKMILDRKLYRDPEISIRVLSNHVDIPYYELSKLINRNHNRNFNNYINRFRVLEVANSIKAHALTNYNVMGLAQNAGFRSSSAFYSAFKQEMGTTPLDYMNRYCS